MLKRIKFGNFNFLNLNRSKSKQQLLLEIQELRLKLEELLSEKADLELLLETTAEHSDIVAENLVAEKADLELLLQTITEHADIVEESLVAEKTDLELLLETITEHSDFVEEELQKKKELIRQLFGRYLSDEVVDSLLENPERVKLGGVRQKLTILTSDLRGFTTLSEQIRAEEVIKILNFYLKHMADVIIQYHGTINEFMGDGILVYFGAPTIREDDAKRAVACACAMQLAMEKVNAKMKEWDFPRIEMGIGINTGEVVVGNIGSEKRTKYSAIGSPVNLTFRIESYTTGGQILISESTLKEVEPIIKIEGQQQVILKGVKEPITIYEVGGMGGEYNLFLPKKEEKLVTLGEAIPIQYALVEGKYISDSIFKGSIVQLSEREALVSYDQAPDQQAPLAWSNIKLNLLISNNSAEVSEDIYAKVLAKQASKGSFYIGFTYLSPSVKEKLEHFYTLIKTTG